jgi:co-chaperonin GroES (HSP10)
MSVIIPRRAIDAVSMATDTKAEILKHLGDLSTIDVMYNMILLAFYVKPGITKGGIILADQTKEEDIWQGKVGMVVKWGKDAFQDDEDMKFNGQRAGLGEWVVFKIGDGWRVQIRDWPCCLVRDSSIKMKVTDPSIIL